MVCLALTGPQLSDVKQQLRAANEALENERAQHAISAELAATKEAAAAEVPCLKREEKRRDGHKRMGRKK
jgi:hypothetical protein